MNSRSLYDQKHAYLIIAHNNFNQLKLLVELLDHEKNDIYIHIDRRSKSFKSNAIKTKYSQVTFIKRTKVTWGGHSLIKCKLNLLKSATKKHYSYYHFLSGADLPIKTQKEIHEFFSANAGLNFMEFDKAANETKEFIWRVHYYYLFQDITGRKDRLFHRILDKIENLTLQAQAILRIKRKTYIPLYKGSNWVSITDDFARYILSNKNFIKKQFYYADCADELFMQSLAMSSRFKETINEDYHRHILWVNGQVHIYTAEDVPELLKSNAFWARKFDEQTNPEAIKSVCEYLKTKNGG